jgi:hypothetical protein
MHRASRSRSVLVVGMMAAGIHLTGCFPFPLYDDCEHTLTHCSVGEGGAAPTGCVPSKNADAVDNSCGVFVATSGDDAGSGAKETPVKTLAAAIALAQTNKTGRVYACAEEFEEAVEVAAGVTIYGGLDCANAWRWAVETKKTTLTAAEGTIPLTMRGGDGAAKVRIEDVHVQARAIDSGNVELRGASSIAALADSVIVELARCVVEAGDAAPGAAGAAYETSAGAGSDGNSGNEACSASMIFGGGETLNDCGTPGDTSDDSIGGGGGVGQQNSGGDGTNGTPGAAMNGGTGETALTVCTPGTDGDSGVAGTSGTGAAGLGELSATGYAGTAGGDGMKGAPAQGGGGGGGAKGGTGANQCTPGSGGGASGGSGGAGGCGGAGGKGGGAGGSSIALISLDATLYFDAVTLKTGRGAAGGAGGLGQNGGNGGAGGPGGSVPATVVDLKTGCDGGKGGKGGAGGPGGGGLGGHSIGIAYRGTAPEITGATVTTGEAGPGGAGADVQHRGAAGTKADAQQF